MKSYESSLISFVIPLFNEQSGLTSFHESLIETINSLNPNNYSFEIIYINDGSTDSTNNKLNVIAASDKKIRVIALSKNFGKEIATTAGISIAQGDAIITIDADGQHPVELIPSYIKSWQQGNLVVIGKRISNRGEGFIKRFGSVVFYKLFNKLTRVNLVPGATDFRLIDKIVQADFVRLSEHNRITRGLIDWLGYKRSYIEFDAKARAFDQSGYSFQKLSKLAVDSVISLSSSPLYITAYIGIVILPLSALLGLIMVVDKIFNDPLGWHTTGGAFVLILVLFLIGVLMMSQGIIGLYLSHIHSETQNRPLYIVDRQASTRL
ncbi:MAG: glycosyltransferase family 2 protein [Candidatus Saccharimonadales bacterium]